MMYNILKKILNVTGNFSLTFIKTINTNNIHILHASTIKQQTKKKSYLQQLAFFCENIKPFQFKQYANLCKHVRQLICKKVTSLS